MPTMGTPAGEVSKKRKAGTNPNNAQPTTIKRAKVRDARTIAAQSSEAALSNTGELDVSAFVAARQFEIRALNKGLRDSKSALTLNAFQKVPRSLRRRTASHNVKRVPRRLRARARQELNPPTTNAHLQTSSSLHRIRLETARRLQGLNARTKSRKKQNTAANSSQAQLDPQHGVNIAPRVPKIKKNKLSHPETPPSKFKKRQRYKTWLPTHMFHAKRAHMTPTTAPLWRFSVPLTPTEKSYRPTHRASGARGAIAWDMSYISTIGLEGVEESLEGLLKALGVGGNEAWGMKGRKWRAGTRSLDKWMFERDGDQRAIAPTTIIWCPVSDDNPQDVDMVDASPQSGKGVKSGKVKRATRKIFVRVHPSAFLQLWEEILNVAKIQKPKVMIEDLRFEIGSIEVTGPGSTEALLSALKPVTSPQVDENSHLRSPEEVWSSLTGLTNAASLPPNAFLSFNVSDPRLRYPPRTIPLSHSEESYAALSTILSTWSPDETASPVALFDRQARLKASRLLPSQKTINRRKSVAVPGEYPPPKSTDPEIPVIILASRPGGTTGDKNSQGCWKVLLPWKCVRPVWYSTLYYPLSSGGNPRFGGLQEKRQLAFESGEPWFPGNFPGTQAGWEWEKRERETQKDRWERKPKGKRPEFDSLNLGYGRTKGEVGLGWACDWERLLGSRNEGPSSEGDSGNMENTSDSRSSKKRTSVTPFSMHQLVPSTASSLLHHFRRGTLPPSSFDMALSKPALVTVKISLLNRGTPSNCARVYRLPKTNTSLRARWLSMLLERYSASSRNINEKNKPQPSEDSLVFPPPDDGNHDHVHPPIPGEEELIGFVISGNYNLSAGKGTAIGALHANKIGSSPPEIGGASGMQEDEARVFKEAIQRFGKEKVRKMCIVRAAGESVGRLGGWDVA